VFYQEAGTGCKGGGRAVPRKKGRYLLSPRSERYRGESDIKLVPSPCCNWREQQERSGGVEFLGELEAYGEAAGSTTGAARRGNAEGRTGGWGKEPVCELGGKKKRTAKGPN